MTSALLTVEDLAQLLAKPKSWIYDNRRSIPHIKINNGLRFRLSDVEAWLDSQAVSGC